jgi:hypothetical protein
VPAAEPVDPALLDYRQDLGLERFGQLALALENPKDE